MKKITFLLALIIAGSLQAQITFKGCINNLENQNFELSTTGTTNSAGTVRNTFESTPSNFTQDCPAGKCEIRIIWNIANARWEIQLDNDGPETNPDYTTAVLYYNTTASFPNPPDLSLGTWHENSTETQGTCGGNLTDLNGVLTGDVQNSTTLSVEEVLQKSIKIYPNPASKFLTIESGLVAIESVSIVNILGKHILSTKNYSKINVEHLAGGLYFISIKTDKETIVKKIAID
ncbi:MAG: T9SS type A sorting domain-containing protein [Aestuariibaculum sp.]